MFVKPKDKPWLADAVVAVEAKIKFHPQFDKGPNCEVQIMYVNSKTGTSFGTCPMKEHLFSDATRKALLAFLSSVESDFAQVMFSAGPSEGQVETGAAESTKPLSGLGDT